MAIDWKRLFLAMDGRIGRQEFWIGFVVIIVASIAVNLVPVVGQIAGLLLIWPMVAIHSKRLHDMGRTAFLQLAPFAVAVVSTVLAVLTGGVTVLVAMMQNDNAALARAAGGVGLTMLFIALPFLFGFAFLAWVGLSRGQPEPNRFGPPPVRAAA